MIQFPGYPAIHGLYQDGIEYSFGRLKLLGGLAKSRIYCSS